MFFILLPSEVYIIKYTIYKYISILHLKLDLEEVLEFDSCKVDSIPRLTEMAFQGQCMRVKMCAGEGFYHSQVKLVK